LATALAVDPGRLNASLRRAPSKNPILPDWARTFTAWDTVIIEPGKALDIETFFPPLPIRALVHRLQLAFLPEAKYADLTRILDCVRMNVKADGKLFLSGGVAMFGNDMGLRYSSKALLQPSYALRLNEDFRVLFDSPAIQLSEPVPLMVSISGLLPQEFQSANAETLNPSLTAEKSTDI
jgi:hypothetical protein